MKLQDLPDSRDNTNIGPYKHPSQCLSAFRRRLLHLKISIKIWCYPKTSKSQRRLMILLLLVTKFYISVTLTIYHFVLWRLPCSVGDLLLGYPPYQLIFWNAITNVKLALDISWIFPSARPNARPSTSPAACPLPLPAARSTDSPVPCPTASPAPCPLPRHADVPIAYQLIVWIASTSTVTKTTTSNLVLQLLRRTQYCTNLIESLDFKLQKSLQPTQRLHLTDVSHQSASL